MYGMLWLVTGVELNQRLLVWSIMTLHWLIRFNLLVL